MYDIVVSLSEKVFSLYSPSFSYLPLKYQLLNWYFLQISVREGNRGSELCHRLLSKGEEGTVKPRQVLGTSVLGEGQSVLGPSTESLIMMGNCYGLKKPSFSLFFLAVLSEGGGHDGCT